MDKYLNEDAITAEIMSYVKNRIYNYAVLIDGDWGTGKTYFIQKSIIPTLEGSGYMPIYISLYGVNSTDTVSQKIAPPGFSLILSTPFRYLCSSWISTSISRRPMASTTLTVTPFPACL